MVYFCQPEGCMSVGPRRTGTAIREANSFVFTLTDKDSGKTRYGVCVNFYRPVERYVPSGSGIPNAASGTLAKRARNSALRRESWRKSMEKSSDSAFSRQVEFSYNKSIDFNVLWARQFIFFSHDSSQDICQFQGVYAYCKFMMHIYVYWAIPPNDLLYHMNVLYYYQI